MKFICAQPTIDYYAWQVEVMINNFIENGVNPEDIQIVGAFYGNIPVKWQNLQKKYKNVQFSFYKDDRQRARYISSIRPHVLNKHWLKYPELENEVVFYHDCDILLSKSVDFKKLEQGVECYVSDTVSYIGARYIRSKGEHYLDLMADVIGLDKQIIINNEKDSGGAQYILKGITAEFWNKVYHDSENLWRLVNSQIKKDNPSHAIQIWCADMWAVLWNLWFFDKTVRVVDGMSFSWATSAISEWDKHPIFHNAGVTGDGQKLFYKGQYQTKVPYDIKLEDFDSKRCSIKYVEAILKTKEVTCLK